MDKEQEMVTMPKIVWDGFQESHEGLLKMFEEANKTIVKLLEDNYLRKELE